MAIEREKKLAEAESFDESIGKCLTLRHKSVYDVSEAGIFAEITKFNHGHSPLNG